MSLVSSLPDRVIRSIENKMRPGALSGVGFLASHESLKDVIERDERTLSHLGITYAQIADRLESIVGQTDRLDTLLARETVRARKSQLTVYQGNLLPVILVEKKYWVCSVHWKGSQRCPFENESGEACPSIDYSNSDHRLITTDGLRMLQFPGMIIHLIRDHHLFEGYVAHRVNPAAAALILGLEKGRDYAPKWEREDLWHLSGGLGVPPENGEWDSHEEQLTYEQPEEILEPLEGVKIHLREDAFYAISDREVDVPRSTTIKGLPWESWGEYGGMNYLREGIETIREANRDRPESGMRLEGVILCIFVALWP